MNKHPETPSCAEPSRHWSAFREAGSLRGFQFLFYFNRLLGRKAFSVCMFPVMCYFMLRRKNARRASLDFLRTHFHYAPTYFSKRPGYFQVLMHFIQFGEVILDKFLAWSSKINENEFDICNQKNLQDLLDDSRGQLIIGSHFGNLEYCRGFMQRYKNKTINILVYDKHAANFVAMMQKINADSRLHVYQVTELDIATTLKLKEKIDQGQWLFIAGDRVPISGQERTVTATFLGRRAAFPIGPYILAKTLQCPVKLMFSYRHEKKVVFDVVPFSEKIDIARKDRQRSFEKWAQKFSNEMQKHCVGAPYQWFNFYDFWTDSKPYHE